MIDRLRRVSTVRRIHLAVALILAVLALVVLAFALRGAVRGL